MSHIGHMIPSIASFIIAKQGELSGNILLQLLCQNTLLCPDLIYLIGLIVHISLLGSGGKYDAEHERQMKRFRQDVQKHGVSNTVTYLNLLARMCDPVNFDMYKCS